MVYVWRASASVRRVGKVLDVTCRLVLIRVRFATTVRVRETALMEDAYVVLDMEVTIVV